jgi:predicted double-glycine peptidase
MDMWLLQGGLSGQYHAVVVIGVNSDNVTVLDPQIGERRLPRGDFQAAWAAMHFLTIVIGM